MIALRNILRRPLRSAFTVGGIALGTAAYLLIVSTAHSLVIEGQASIDALGTDVAITRDGLSVPWVSRLTAAEVSTLRTIPGVRNVSRLVIGVTRIQPKVKFFVFGVDPRERIASSLPIIRGRRLGPGADELVIGETAARNLDVRAGDAVEVMNHRFTVSGVYRTRRALLDNAAMIDLAAADPLFAMNGQVTMAFLDLRGRNELDPVLAAVQRRLPQLAATPSDIFAASFARAAIIQKFARTLALLALLISALSLSNTLSMNVIERRQEIAILRAVGWRRGRIAAMVVGEATLLLVAGALIAIPLSLGLLHLLARADSLGIVPASLALTTAAEGFASALLIGFLLSLIPLSQVLRIEPAAALRAL